MIERLNAPPKTEEKKELKNYVIWAELNEAKMMADGPMDANNTTQAVCWRRRQTSAHINHPLFTYSSTQSSHLISWQPIRAAPQSLPSSDPSAHQSSSSASDSFQRSTHYNSKSPRLPLYLQPPAHRHISWNSFNSQENEMKDNIS